MAEKNYINPRPIAVMMVPVVTPNPPEFGLLIGMRDIQPAQGTFGLPGGWMEVIEKDGVQIEETVEQAALRELREETGIILPDSHVQISHSAVGETIKQQILIFCYSTWAVRWQDVMPDESAIGYRENELNPHRFKPSRECSAVSYITQRDFDNPVATTELSFPTHTAAAKLFFENGLWKPAARNTGLFVV